MATSDEINPFEVNLKRTQRGYVPLEDRFKSFPPDSSNAPVTNQQFYYNNQANKTLEHADLGLLFPTPKWLRLKLRRRLTPTLIGCLATTDDKVIVMEDGKCLAMFQS